MDAEELEASVCSSVRLSDLKASQQTNGKATNLPGVVSVGQQVSESPPFASDSSILGN